MEVLKINDLSTAEFIDGFGYKHAANKLGHVKIEKVGYNTNMVSSENAGYVGVFSDHEVNRMRHESNNP